MMSPPSKPLWNEPKRLISVVSGKYRYLDRSDSAPQQGGAKGAVPAGRVVGIEHLAKKWVCR